MSLPFNGLPVWVKAAGTIGLPGLIALYLVYQMASALPKTIAAHDSDSHRDSRAIINLLSLVCANTAPDAGSRAQCFRNGETR